MFSTLAGFVEPGESLEETVQREIREEVGVDVADIRYFGSQPWPFPNSLMIGFMARWCGNEIRLGLRPDGEQELEEAAWFKITALPRIPSRISIARALIDTFIASRDTTHPKIPMDHHGTPPPT
jgi:NAD+ diphosphatase